jgi:hypothetical protein
LVYGDTGSEAIQIQGRAHLLLLGVGPEIIQPVISDGISRGELCSIEEMG